MAIQQGMCTVFKTALLNGEMDFSADTAQTFRMALYTESADLGADTTAYTASNEVSGTGYTAGGELLSGITVSSSGSVAFVDFNDITWSSATFTARGALIYQVGSNTAIAVLDFGENKQASAADFTVSFPTANASNAVIRLS